MTVRSTIKRCFVAIVYVSISFALAATPSTQAALTDSLELYYNFDADTTAAGGITDQSGNTRNGSGVDIDSGGINYSFSTDVPSAIFGNSIDLGGTSDYVISDTPGYNGITGTTERTVAAWVKLDNLTQSTTLMEWGLNTNGLRWAFRVNSAASNGTVGGLRVEIAGDFIIGSDAINDSEWHHVAATFVDDGTPNVEDVSLYVDGVLQTTFTSGPGNPLINTSGLNQVTIGSSQLITGDNRTVDGLMDDVAIWSRALSGQEIATLAAGTVIIPEPSTLALLSLAGLLLAYRRCGRR